ncbi:MAG: SDR family oxidoreductase [Chromatiales bacterium]|nr:SDR family oxidoreductase [Chromatiales bacterium]
MKYPKLTVFLGLVVLLVAWVLISGMEGDRPRAVLNPVSATPAAGAVLVIGGTRATGLEVVRLLRARGDDVVVLVRPSSDAGEVEALGARIVRGDALNPGDLAAALKADPAGGQFRAIVSTLGGRSLDGPRPDFEGNRNAVDAARLAGVRRFVLVTVIGAGESRDAAPAIARYVLRNVIPEKSKAEDYLKTSGLDYTIIRPGGLLDKEPQGRAYLTEDTRAMSWIRRSDLAALTVQALDDPRAIGKVYHAFDPDRTRFWSIPAN